MAKATGGSGSDAWRPPLSGSAEDAKARAAEDATQRRAAGAHPRSVILTARDVQEGKYDIARLLMTTLGGVERDLTHDDLAAFRRNAKIVANRYTAGIRARQIIDLSMKHDRDLATKEIRSAIPVASHGGRVRFLTNAGPNYGATHHHVIVDFLSFSSQSTGGMGGAKAAALRVRRDPLKIECDCGRWRFWFRYIATIGKYNAGRDETGYPKQKNPDLKGVACKHALRVAYEIESAPSVLLFLTRMIDKARAKDDNQIKTSVTQKEAEQAAARLGSNVRDADSFAQRQARRIRERAAIIRAVLTSKLPEHRTSGSRREGENPGSIASRFGMAIESVKRLFR